MLHKTYLNGKLIKTETVEQKEDNENRDFTELESVLIAKGIITRADLEPIKEAPIKVTK